jgi:small subunit ribosomal protein S12
MATLNQRILQVYKRTKRNKKPKLNKGPQKKGVVLRLRICTPRKPNSARRPVVKLKLSTKKKALAHIPGSGHNLKKFSKILINGNGARDLPVVNYSCIRGVFDFNPLYGKKKKKIYLWFKTGSIIKNTCKTKIKKFKLI